MSKLEMRKREINKELESLKLLENNNNKAIEKLKDKFENKMRETFKFKYNIETDVRSFSNDFVAAIVRLINGTSKEHFVYYYIHPETENYTKQTTSLTESTVNVSFREIDIKKNQTAEAQEALEFLAEAVTKLPIYENYIQNELEGFEETTLEQKKLSAKRRELEKELRYLREIEEDRLVQETLEKSKVIKVHDYLVSTKRDYYRDVKEVIVDKQMPSGEWKVKVIQTSGITGDDAGVFETNVRVSRTEMRKLIKLMKDNEQTK